MSSLISDGIHNFNLQSSEKQFFANPAFPEISRDFDKFRESKVILIQDTTNQTAAATVVAVVAIRG